MSTNPEASGTNSAGVVGYDDNPSRHDAASIYDYCEDEIFPDIGTMPPAPDTDLADVKVGYKKVTNRFMKCCCDHHLNNEHQDRTMDAGMICDRCGFVFCEDCRRKLNDNLSDAHSCELNVMDDSFTKPMSQTKNKMPQKSNPDTDSSSVPESSTKGQSVTRKRKGSGPALSLALPKRVKSSNLEPALGEHMGDSSQAVNRDGAFIPMNAESSTYAPAFPHRARISIADMLDDARVPLPPTTAEFPKAVRSNASASTAELSSLLFGPIEGMRPPQPGLQTLVAKIGAEDMAKLREGWHAMRRLLVLLGELDEFGFDMRRSQHE